MAQFNSFQLSQEFTNIMNVIKKQTHVRQPTSAMDALRIVETSKPLTPTKLRKLVKSFGKAEFILELAKLNNIPIKSDFNNDIVLENCENNLRSLLSGGGMVFRQRQYGLTPDDNPKEFDKLKNSGFTNAKCNYMSKDKKDGKVDYEYPPLGGECKVRGKAKRRRKKRK